MLYRLDVDKGSTGGAAWEYVFC